MSQSILTSGLPRFIQPMLAQPGVPFDSPEHLFEIKWNGTRVLAFVDQGGYRLVNRHRVDVTDRYPEWSREHITDQKRQTSAFSTSECAAYHALNLLQAKNPLNPVSKWPQPGFQWERKP